jgi:nucleotide-binding universal stress UspA family protein
MLHKFSRILYATDLTPNSAYVFRYALDTANIHGARIIILHVIEPLSPTAEMLIGYHLAKDKRNALLGERIEYAVEQIRQRLKNFIDKEVGSEYEADTLVEKIDVCQGFPVEEILKKSSAYGCDLIVMGTHGKGVIKNTFLGSTARRLLRRVRHPVFIVPLPDEEAPAVYNHI